MENYRLYAMRDTGENFSMLTQLAAKPLELQVLPFCGNFLLADGRKECCVGKLGKAKL